MQRFAAGIGRVGRQVAEPRVLRAIAPGVLPLVLLPFVAPLIRKELNEPLFGDTAVFQYVAWCMRHGMRLYRDIGMADGPFIYYLHVAIQTVAGLTDRDFRRGDIWLQGGGGALIGLFLTPISDLPRVGRVLQRVAWAGLGAAVWLAWYLTLDWGTTTEREVYYILFGSLGMTLLYVSGDWAPKWGAVAAFAGGFLVTTQVFGKPTGLTYVAMGGWCLLLADPPSMRRARIKMALAGAAACVAALLIAFLVSGSLTGYFFWCFTIPARGNAFLFRVDRLRLLLVAWEPFRTTAIGVLAGGLAAAAAGIIPKKVIPFVCAPAMLFVGACLQGRGFLYQVEPTAGAANLVLLVTLASLWRETSRPRWASQRGMLAAALLVFATLYLFDGIQKSPYRWTGDEANWTAASPPWKPEERAVGAYLKERTKPDDYVFAYGGDAHVVLYYAERRTATPFFHSFWMDPIGLLSYSEIQPTASERATLEGLQTTIRERGCGAVQDRPPAAMVFNSLDDIFRICPKVKPMLASQYTQATKIGALSVYLRKQ